jgi:hypothetical protein
MGKAAAKKKTIDYATLKPLARRAATVRVKFSPSWPVPAIESMISMAEQKAAMAEQAESAKQRATQAEQRAAQAEQKAQRQQQKVDPAANWKKFLNTGRVTGKQDKTLLHTVGAVYSPCLSSGQDSKREAAIRGYINRTIALMYQGGWFTPEKNALVERAFGKPTE